jgi:hypothetical protein
MNFKISTSCYCSTCCCNKCAVGASDCKPESVTNQPCVESIKTNVTAIPSVDKVALIVEPPILSEPF